MASHLQMKWAERDDKLFITVEVVAAKDVEVDFQANAIQISIGEGIIKQGGEPSKALKSTVNLNDAIKPSESSFKVLGQGVQICAVKEEKKYWNKLTKESVKETKGWLSVDWNLWKDEDDEEDKANLGDFGMGGMGGMGDLSSMLGGMGGGMGGMPDMSALQGMMGGAGGDSDDEYPEEAEEEGEENPDAPAANLKDLDA